MDRLLLSTFAALLISFGSVYGAVPLAPAGEAPPQELVEITEVDDLAIASDDTGFYVITRSYHPPIPDDLPDDMKPSTYLLSLDPAMVQWKSADDYTPLFIAYDALHGDKGVEGFPSGTKLALPIALNFKSSSPGPLENLQVDGGLLLEVVGSYETFEEVSAIYGPALSDDSPADFLKFVREDGTFYALDTSEDGTSTMTGGPLEEGWSLEAKTRTIKFYTDFYLALGCFIATEVYGSYAAHELDTLRAFRDEILLATPSGRKLVAYYYRLGPGWAQQVGDRPYLKQAIGSVLNSTVWVLERINMQDPLTRKVLFWHVEVVEWILSPWLEEEVYHARNRDDAEHLKP